MTRTRSQRLAVAVELQAWGEARPMDLARKSGLPLSRVTRILLQLRDEDKAFARMRGRWRLTPLGARYVRKNLKIQLDMKS